MAIVNDTGGGGGYTPPNNTAPSGRPWRKPLPGEQPTDQGWLSNAVGSAGSGMRGIGNGMEAGFNWLGGNQGTGKLGDDRYFTYKQLAGGSPYIDNQSPYAGQYGQLITMLQNRAQGIGPSVAGDAYKTASTDAMSRAATLSNSGNAGATRLALQQMGNQEQGLAQGYATARNQEMVGATGQLSSTLNSADSSQLLRDKANQEAWLQMLKDIYQGDSTTAQTSKNNGDEIGSIIKSFASF
jgi:hypothetical protein